MTTAIRLPAAERRRALVDTALRVFAEGSYRGTTTAEIAREAGVSEPILYRHFASKRDLYLACIDESWQGLRAMWDDAIAAAESSREFLPAMSGCYLSIRDAKHRVAELWMQADGTRGARSGSRSLDLRRRRPSRNDGASARRPAGRGRLFAHPVVTEGVDDRATQRRLNGVTGSNPHRGLSSGDGAHAPGCRFGFT